MLRHMTTDHQWRMSSACSGGNCAEMADTGEAVLLRDNKDLKQPPLNLTAEQWRCFTEALRDDVPFE
jgi:hypothetical protein